LIGQEHRADGAFFDGRVHRWRKAILWPRYGPPARPPDLPADTNLRQESNPALASYQRPYRRSSKTMLNGSIRLKPAAILKCYVSHSSSLSDFMRGRMPCSWSWSSTHGCARKHR
jgi:hypothetical protein